MGCGQKRGGGTVGVGGRGVFNHKYMVNHKYKPSKNHPSHHKYMSRKTVSMNSMHGD